jgi:hypothetical protein
MLFPVTIYSAKGKVKEVVSKEMLHRRHWKLFQDNENKYTFQGSVKNTVSKELKAKLDMQFTEGLMNSRN